MIDRAVAAAGDADAVVVATYNVDRRAAASAPWSPVLLETVEAGRRGRRPQSVTTSPSCPASPPSFAALLLDGRGGAGGGPGDRRAGAAAREAPVPVVRADDPETVLLPARARAGLPVVVPVSRSDRGRS